MSKAPPDFGAGNPGDLPDPPDDLRSRRLPIVDVAGPWFRSSPTGRATVHFGRTGESRFDDPLRRFGVLYLALSAHGAFIETLGGRTAITIGDLTSRTMSVLIAPRSAKLVDLSGQRLAGLGLDGRIFAGDYRVAQRWSRAFWDHPARPDGLLYRSRRDPSQLVLAMYDRDDWRFDVTPLPPSTMTTLADHYELSVD